MSNDLHPGWRYAIVILGMLLSGGVCAASMGFITSPRGAIGPTILQAESPVAAMVAMVSCFTVATIIAMVVSRLMTAGVGLFILGSGLGVVALRSAKIEEIAFSDGSLGLLAVETAIWAGLILAASIAVFAVAHPSREASGTRLGGLSGWRSRSTLVHVASGLIMLPVAWLIARAPMAGQVLMAVFLGGMSAGLAARLLAPQAPPVLAFAAPCLFGAIGPLIGTMTTASPLDEALVRGSIWACCLPMPIDYAAGSLMGVAVGVGWARSFLHEDESSEACGD